MGQPRAARLRTVALALIPGAAHVDLGRAKRGLGWFFLFAFSLNAAWIAPRLGLGPEARWLAAAAAAGTWIAAFAGALRTAALQAAAAPVPEPPPAKPVEESQHAGS